MEEGYTKGVASVIPSGAVWPLPLHEIAMTTARNVAGTGIDDAELTVMTPEAVPLALFGSQASTVVRGELDAAGIALDTLGSRRRDRVSGEVRRARHASSRSRGCRNRWPATSPQAHRPMWRPTRKVFGKYLTAWRACNKEYIERRSVAARRG